MFVLPDVLHVITLVLHILFAVIGVGSVTIVDYFHLIGLRSKRLEKRLVFIYPFLSRMIIGALGGMFITGVLLVANKPELLSSSLFQLKMALFLVIVVNGFFLHKHVSPNLTKCIENGKKYCTQKILWVSAISGTISIVTWYSVFILALTKSYGYTLSNFLYAYITALAFVFLITLLTEKSARKWRT